MLSQNHAQNPLTGSTPSEHRRQVLASKQVIHPFPHVISEQVVPMS